MALHLQQAQLHEQLTRWERLQSYIVLKAMSVKVSVCGIGVYVLLAAIPVFVVGSASTEHCENGTLVFSSTTVNTIRFLLIGVSTTKLVKGTSRLTDFFDSFRFVLCPSFRTQSILGIFLSSLFFYVSYKRVRYSLEVLVSTSGHGQFWFSDFLSYGPTVLK